MIDRYIDDTHRERWQRQSRDTEKEEAETREMAETERNAER